MKTEEEISSDPPSFWFILAQQRPPYECFPLIDPVRQIGGIIKVSGNRRDEHLLLLKLGLPGR
jgi:hypothetical protein